MSAGQQEEGHGVVHHGQGEHHQTDLLFSRQSSAGASRPPARVTVLVYAESLICDLRETQLKLENTGTQIIDIYRQFVTNW